MDISSQKTKIKKETSKRQGDDIDQKHKYQIKNNKVEEGSRNDNYSNMKNLTNRAEQA